MADVSFPDERKLPDEPSIEQLRKQAKDLRRSSGGTLQAAQRAVARHYGFASWARLKRHVEIVTRYTRFPERMSSEGAAGTGMAEEFLRLACLTYEDDETARWHQARQILQAHPEIARVNVYAAAATAATDSLRAILREDPAAARREGGPFRWEPLLYLAYARHDPDVPEDAVLGAARLLLAAAADPNAGYLWHGLPTPFTVLTGVFGEGELGPVRQPRHPHSLVLARLLLEAGADPNDGQALYNRMFEPGNDHLELLLEFGLGCDDGGPWRRRLGAALDTPAQLVRGELAWAITHGMIERVRLLVGHGAAGQGVIDLTGPLDGGITVTSMAAITGHADLVEFLVAHGAPPPDLTPVGAFTAAVLAADRARLDAVLAGDPGLLEQMRTARPALISWAAACGSIPAVKLLAGLGFDVNARGRTDVPSDQPWQTALHKAAEDGDAELARTLLSLGADPDIRDERFGSTPLGWARYFGQRELIEVLEPLTAPGDAGTADSDA